MRPLAIFVTAATAVLTTTNAFADCPITQEEIRATLRAFPAAQAAEKAGKPSNSNPISFNFSTVFGRGMHA